VTSGSADDSQTPAAPDARREGPSERTAWTAAGVLFLALFWPILEVRYHTYLETPRYSHCVLLPLVAALWIWDRWDGLSRIPRAASARGFALLMFGVAVFLWGRLVRTNYTVQHLGMLVAAAGLAWTLAGAALLRALAFPLAYVALMIPLPKSWDDRLTQPLQAMATGMSEAFFRALGWIVVREGNVLQLPGLKLLVEEGCSGVHSLYALLALAAAWVFFVERPVWLRALLIVAAFPIAVLANAIRVSATGVLAYKIDPKYAQGVSHQTAGMIVFAIGVVLMLFLDWCLKPDAYEPDADEPVA
jgi:exosortase